MQLKKLRFFQTVKIYRTYVRRDFPPAEIKPLFLVLLFLARGIYPAYGLYEEDKMRAYAMLFRPRGEADFVLLDHLAVLSQKRGKGYGSALLKELRQTCGDTGILAEVEDPDYAPSEERRTEMRRRISFYTRAGYRQTAVRTLLFGVRYRILVQGKEAARDAEIEQALRAVYRVMFPGIARRRNVQVEWDEQERHKAL